MTNLKIEEEIICENLLQQLSEEQRVMGNNEKMKRRRRRKVIIRFFPNDKIMQCYRSFVYILYRKEFVFKRILLQQLCWS